MFAVCLREVCFLSDTTEAGYTITLCKLSFSHVTVDNWYDEFVIDKNSSVILVLCRLVGMGNRSNIIKHELVKGQLGW